MTEIMYKILVIDDEEDITEVVCGMLELAGIACEGFNDPKLALDAIATGAFTAVLSDISMPQLNGIDLMKKVRATGNGIPFVFLTAHDDITNVKSALKLGAIDYIQKPFKPKEIVAVMSRAVEIGFRLKKIKDGESPEDTERDLKFIEKLKIIP